MIRNKYAVFLSIMMSLVLIASFIGCSSKSSTSSITTTSTTSATATTTTVTVTATTTTTLATIPALLPGQKLLTTVSNDMSAALLIPSTSAWENCVSCHELGSPGQQNPAMVESIVGTPVIDVISSTHECDDCHIGSYTSGLAILDWDITGDFHAAPWNMTDEEIDTSCLLCHIA